MPNQLEPIAYVDGINCEILCADHGAERDADIARNCADHGDHESHDECGLTAIYSWNSDELDAVEYCACGHSFCGTCGTDLNTTIGDENADRTGPLFRCSNCNTFSVFTDENEFTWVNGFEAATDELAVTVTDVAAWPLDSTVTVRTVIDESTVAMGKVRFFVAFRLHSPIDGNVLVLADRWHAAHEAARDFFVSDDDNVTCEADEYDIASDVMVFEAATSAIRFSTKSVA